MQPKTYYRLTAVFADGETIVLRTNQSFRYLLQIKILMADKKLYTSREYKLVIDWQGIDKVCPVDATGEPS